HRLGRDEEWEQLRRSDGALKALEQAKREGLVRFLGVTGHYDPAVLTRAITEYEFDTILMALNCADPHYLPFTERLLPVANRKNMGVIAKKIPARGRLFREGGLRSMKDAMQWVLTQPVSTVIVGCDSIEQLEENVAIAADFEPLGGPAMRRISALTAGYAKEAQFYKKGTRHRGG
ncbi:MAG: aldo/keto reductase, partial [Gemmatimonadales bacterium]|nr:aldo/keto reductase [Gemmatimonadales bacterium]